MIDIELPLHTERRVVKSKKIDSRRMTIITYGHGIKRGTPRRCIRCHHPIRQGELWRTISSPQDSTGARTTIIVHRECPPKSSRQRRC